MNVFSEFLYIINSYLCFWYYTYIYGEYPLSFLLLLNKETINFALHRKEEIQEKYTNTPYDEKRRFINNVKDELKENSVYLRKNDFPYNIPWYVKHYVMWMKPGLTMNDEALCSAIKSSIIAEFKVSLKFVYFRNAIKNKSIPEIEHYHVFIVNTF